MMGLDGFDCLLISLCICLWLAVCDECGLYDIDLSGDVVSGCGCVGVCGWGFGWCGCLQARLLDCCWVWFVGVVWVFVVIELCGIA